MLKNLALFEENAYNQLSFNCEFYKYIFITIIPNLHHLLTHLF